MKEQINKKENRKEEMMQDWQVDKIVSMVKSLLESRRLPLTKEEADEFIRMLTEKEYGYLKKILGKDPSIKLNY